MPRPVLSGQLRRKALIRFRSQREFTQARLILHEQALQTERFRVEVDAQICIRELELMMMPTDEAIALNARRY